MTPETSGQISLGAGTAKLRNPLVVAIFDLITIGIYGVVWYYKVNRELALMGRLRKTTDLGTNPTNSLLALVPGLIIIVPAVISIVNSVKRLRLAQELAGIPEEEWANLPLGSVLLFLLPPIGSWYFQKRLNAVWNADYAGRTNASAAP